MQGILTETVNGSVTGFVAIPSVIFFPGFRFQHLTFHLMISFVVKYRNREDNYEAVSDDDEPDYEFLNESFTSTRRPGNLAPTLPPMATHPMITGRRSAGQQRDMPVYEPEPEYDIA